MMARRTRVFRRQDSASRGRRHGFTLIELLVVVGIIALLMAVLLSTLQAARKRAKAVVCQANLRQWGTTLALYTQENQGRLPDLAGSVWLLRGAFASEGDPNEPRVEQPIRTQGIACCPMATQPFEGIRSFSVGELKGHSGATFRAWQINRPGPPFLGSYGFSEQLLHVRPIRSRWFGGLDVFSRRNTAETPLLLDSAQVFGGLTNPFLSPPRTETSGEAKGCIINRHNGRVNGLMLDLSVRPIGIKELWTLKWYPGFDTAGRWTKAGGVKPEDWPPWMRNFRDY